MLVIIKSEASGQGHGAECFGWSRVGDARNLAEDCLSNPKVLQHYMAQPDRQLRRLTRKAPQIGG